MSLMAIQAVAAAADDGNTASTEDPERSKHGFRARSTRSHGLRCPTAPGRYNNHQDSPSIHIPDGPGS